MVLMAQRYRLCGLHLLVIITVFFIWICSTYHMGYGKNVMQYNAFGSTLVMQGFLLWRKLSSVNNVYWQNQIQVIEESIQWLQREGSTSGWFSSKDYFLMGHSAGAHLASTVALRWPSESKHQLKGVITLSGVYDVTSLGFLGNQMYIIPAFGADTKHLTEASPMSVLETHTGALPKFLVINARLDLPGLQKQADRFVTRLRAKGVKCHQSIWGWCDHTTILLKFKTRGKKDNLVEVIRDFILNNNELFMS
ncbi:hypothetical protein CAPTEDRAFT_224701 [Capitella teleta]|uniref:Alpha/beta hydrolase fold-3 domain-containing protein n=1 Tax=Capitella teleta TaxID=283909 RepID=R7URC6_CAPTE|nr:hypothetical protein CAPTEDRAFT_224701 [Capitella teleta]|eukprot:ELU09059.1 hypothetical protein CAPTEDRAFT_224701 [Capitella teleta]